MKPMMTTLLNKFPSVLREGLEMLEQVSSTTNFNTRNDDGGKTTTDSNMSCTVTICTSDGDDV